MATIKSSLQKYLPDIVYGANDGIVTTFSIVAGFEGAKLDVLASHGHIIIMLFGLANLAADGVSMGMGNFLSVRASQDLQTKANYKDLRLAINHGIVTFTAFVLFGSLPLSPYFFKFQNTNGPLSSLFFVILALILVGYMRSKITGRSKLMTITETLVVGGIASSVAYGVGLLFRL